MIVNLIRKEGWGGDCRFFKPDPEDPSMVIPETDEEKVLMRSLFGGGELPQDSEIVISTNDPESAVKLAKTLNGIMALRIE